MTAIGKNLASDANKQNVEFITYPGMGHFMEIPYSFISTRVFGHVPTPAWVDYGGDDYELHSLGQEKGYEKVVNFFTEHLLQSKGKL